MEQRLISEFHRIPEILFHNAAGRNLYGADGYIVPIADTEVLVTSEWKLKTQVEVDGRVNLNHYFKNEDARNNAIDRAFSEAAGGKVIVVKIKDYTGMNRLAVLVKRDLV